MTFKRPYNTSKSLCLTTVQSDILLRNFYIDTFAAIMIIAVNTRFLFNEYMEGYGYFISETFRRITKNHPEHQFIFIFDRPYDERFIFTSNITGISTGPPARHPLLWKFWYDFRIPAILKKYKADVFVSPDGHCSLGTKVPQCMVLHDLAFLHYPSFIKTSHLRYWKRSMSKFVHKARRIATVSEFSKEDIIKHYQTGSNKIDVVSSAGKKIFSPLSMEDKTAIKEKYTGGKDFYIYTGSIHPRKNLVNLLKAFSVFKKHQRSGMKLVLAGRMAWKNKQFVKDLENYKYREDVVLTGYVKEQDLAGLTGAAYAMVYPSLHEGFGVPVLEAMQSSVPVITSGNSAMQEIAGEAALYANPADYKSIAQNMMLLYKDESLRQRLVEKGNERAKEFSWDRTADLLWKSIMKAVG